MEIYVSLISTFALVQSILTIKLHRLRIANRYRLELPNEERKRRIDLLDRGIQMFDITFGLFITLIVIIALDWVKRN